MLISCVAEGNRHNYVTDFMGLQVLRTRSIREINTWFEQKTKTRVKIKRTYIS